MLNPGAQVLNKRMIYFILSATYEVDFFRKSDISVVLLPIQPRL